MSVKFLTTIVSIFITLVANASSHNTESQFNKKLNEALGHAQTHKSFVVNFNQELYSAMRDKITKSNGILKIKAPHSWSFELQKPRAELYMSNGIDFWKYVPELKHAQYLKINPNDNSLELNYITLLTNPENIKKLYHISNWTQSTSKILNDSRTLVPVKSDFPPAESAQSVLIKLEPKGDKKQKVLYAILNVRTGLLIELRVVQLNGNRVRLLFSNVKEEDFDAKTFSFVPPQGIVVDKN